MNTLSFSKLTKVIIGLTLLVPTTSLTVFAQEQTAELPSTSRYFKVTTSIMADGTGVDEIIVNSPPVPPEGLSSKHAMKAAASMTAAILPKAVGDVKLAVPNFTWSFGAIPTVGAMIAGYYDRTGYSNMYTGPTNGGLMPMDNSIWGDVVIGSETLHQCPLSATRNGLDGRATRGHVDDYWEKAGTPKDLDPFYEDPYEANGWTEHTLGDCTGDFMESSKWLGFLGRHTDGAASYNLPTDGSEGDLAWMISHGNRQLHDAGYGQQRFYESRGYTVETMFNQYIAEQGLADGFTYAQYKTEIDNGRPVFIHLDGHTMTGVGYNDTSGNLIYVNDPWGVATSMTWGGIYNTIYQHIAVTVIGLASPTAGSFTVGGSVSGLSSGNSVVLQNNGGDDLQIDANGTFNFASVLANGSEYHVTVVPGSATPQTCSVTNGAGTISGANVTNVTVTCSTSTYTVGGSVSGLSSGNSVVLQNNGGDDLQVNVDGTFTFATALANGTEYDVTLVAGSAGPQTCSVTNASGTVSGVNVTNVAVTCSTNTYTVGGAITGLAAGDSVVLQNNGADKLTITGNGSFTFGTAYADGTAYSVAVLTQPMISDQTCKVTNGTGTISGANVSDIEVLCAGSSFPWPMYIPAITGAGTRK